MNILSRKDIIVLLGFILILFEVWLWGNKYRNWEECLEIFRIVGYCYDN